MPASVVVEFELLTDRLTVTTKPLMIDPVAIIPVVKPKFVHLSQLEVTLRPNPAVALEAFSEKAFPGLVHATEPMPVVETQSPEAVAVRGPTEAAKAFRTTLLLRKGILNGPAYINILNAIIPAIPALTTFRHIEALHKW
jgi:hypothetical protein